MGKKSSEEKRVSAKWVRKHHPIAIEKLPAGADPDQTEFFRVGSGLASNLPCNCTGKAELHPTVWDPAGEAWDFM